MYYKSILVSVTETCTVGCRHCGFLGSTREREAEPEQIASWVTQACEFGIPSIIFTGGEPFQRFKLLKAGVLAANDHPLSPRIATFTSSFWGKNAATVDRILDQLPGMNHMYLSTDVFHAERVPPQYVINVIEGAIKRDIADITLCITIGADEEEQQIKSLYRQFDDRLQYHVDRVIRTSFTRTALPTGKKPVPDNFDTECFLRTPIINPNGDLCACHVAKAGAHKSFTDEVYFLGNLNEEPFWDIMARAERDYEYQFLRAFGPQGVARLVQQSPLLLNSVGERTYSSGCDLCCKVLFTDQGKQALREWVADPFHQEIIDAVLERRFSESR